MTTFNPQRDFMAAINRLSVEALKQLASEFGAASWHHIPEDKRAAATLRAKELHGHGIISTEDRAQLARGKKLAEESLARIRAAAAKPAPATIDTAAIYAHHNKPRLVR